MEDILDREKRGSEEDCDSEEDLDSDTEKEIQGICWKCHGVDLQFFVDPAAWTQQRPETEYGGLWSDIRQDCALCNELKDMLLEYLTSDLVRGPYLSSDLLMTSALEDMDDSKCTPKYMRLHLSTNYNNNAADILLVPTSVFPNAETKLHDLSLVKSWIKECQETHTDHCDDGHSFGHPLRVIDCTSRKLCHIAPDTPYICLSYVWGPASGGDEESLKLPPRLPKTIEDSIYVALQLNIPYLWIDRYFWRTFLVDTS
jgi:hypothetical protein